MVNDDVALVGNNWSLLSDACANEGEHKHEQSCSASPRHGFGWEDRWDNFTGPQAKAHHLLKGLDLGHSGSALRQAGQIIFEEFGGSPANSFTWVELRDDLTVSLLQARLIELNLPINVVVGTRD